MDIWGVGCVFFEVMSLYPLFPGTNELDQITKIHSVLGTPSPATLDKLKKHSNSHIDFNFPAKEGTPFATLLPHCSADCVDLITKLLAYDSDDRISARQAVKHPYFRELRAADKQGQQVASANEEETADGVPSIPAITVKRSAEDRSAHAAGMVPALAPAADSALPTIMRGVAAGGKTGAGKSGAVAPNVSPTRRTEARKGGSNSDAEGSGSQLNGCNGSSKLGHDPNHVPSQSSVLPNIHAAAGADGTPLDAGTLPAIGGALGSDATGSGVGLGLGGLGSISGLSIGSKSTKPPGSKLHRKGGGEKKKPAPRSTTLPAFSGSLQSRSLERLGRDAFELSVSNGRSASMIHQHAQQPRLRQLPGQPFELDGVGISRSLPKPKPAHLSPYSQSVHRAKKSSVLASW
jgi:renal tumor antigen